AFLSTYSYARIRGIAGIINAASGSALRGQGGKCGQPPYRFTKLIAAQGVYIGPATSSDTNQFLFTQRGQMVTNQGLFQLGGFLELADGVSPLSEQQHNGPTRLIGQSFQFRGKEPRLICISQVGSAYLELLCFTHANTLINGKNYCQQQILFCRLSGTSAALKRRGRSWAPEGISLERIGGGADV